MLLPSKRIGELYCEAILQTFCCETYIWFQLQIRQKDCDGIQHIWARKSEWLPLEGPPLHRFCYSLSHEMTCQFKADLLRQCIISLTNLPGWFENAVSSPAVYSHTPGVVISFPGRVGGEKMPCLLPCGLGTRLLLESQLPSLVWWVTAGVVVEKSFEKMLEWA